jgi:lipopolysaccharide export system protein LptA
LHGSEASADQDSSNVHIEGNVRLVTDGGLEARAEVADYSDNNGIVGMPGEASFKRSWMNASAQSSRFDRRRDRLYLLTAARVEILSGESEIEPVVIVADSATLNQTDGFMVFSNNVVVDTGIHLMESKRARIILGSETNALDSLRLNGDARVRATVDESGQFRSMSAANIRVFYASGRSERIVLQGMANVELAGHGSGTGTRISAESIEVLTNDSGAAKRIDATTEVVANLGLPNRGQSKAEQEILADSLRIVSTDDDYFMAGFVGSVEYRESDGRIAAEGNDVRTINAGRLEALLGSDFAGLNSARFLFNVNFLDQTLQALADEAIYEPVSGILSLSTNGEQTEKNLPRMVDARGSLQAELLTIELNGPSMVAVGSVESVLGGSRRGPTAGVESSVENDPRRPGLLSPDGGIFVSSDRFEFDPDTSVAVYTAEAPNTARLWQENTEFRGMKIVLDESSGNLNVEGAARTRTSMVQTNDQTGVVEETVSIGQAGSMIYDNTTKKAAYSTDARLRGPHTDLKADTIEILLKDDSKTLEQIVASSNVTLELETRFVSGSRLIYDDIEGKYEMQGQPVRIVEQTGEEANSECRETTGRSLTFFISAADVSVDGESEIRTSSSSGGCELLLAPIILGSFDK